MLCFSSSGMSESPTHSCKVQWDCWLISVQPYSQCGKSLADKRHTPEQVAQKKGESLVSCSETQLTPSFPSACVFSQIRSNLAIRNDRGDRLTFTQLWTKKFALGSQKQAVPRTDSLIFPVVSANPALPPWLSQWPMTLASGLEQRPNRLLLPQEVTPPSPTASSYKHMSTLLITLE